MQQCNNALPLGSADGWILSRGMFGHLALSNASSNEAELK